MAYDPFPEQARQVRAYFAERAADRPGVAEALDAYLAARTLDAARALLVRFFAAHRPGDVRGLRHVAAAFADKRVALGFVDELLADERRLHAVAARSYPHPIGFDKLVLHDEPGPAGFKLRLHVYWRTPQELATELIHLHRFEMASSPITGEITNHLYAVRTFEAGGVVTSPAGDGDDAGGSPCAFHAYTGYERGADGVLRKRWLGRAGLARTSSVTFVPGQTYAQALEDAHYVETNAETGHTNGDVCSTIYLHGPSLTDAASSR